MALIVEDGTGKSDAESYISVTDAAKYHADRGNAAWVTVSALPEQLLRRATEYIDRTYRARWKGARVLTAQALDWPRADVDTESSSVPSDSVPLAVCRACAELALRADSVELTPDYERGVVMEKVGAIEVHYDQASTQRKPRYEAIDAMLAPYLKPGGGASVGLVRA